MNTTRLPVRPDVAAFVDRVRDLLADLPEEDRLELTEGLEADLADQVAEHGGGVLGDPGAYVRELRAAAGLDPAPRRRLGRGQDGARREPLDAARSWWDAQVARPTVAPVWGVVRVLRPAWWVLRAWAATMMIALLAPGWYDYGLAWLPGVHPAWGVIILAVCIVGSVLVGLGRAWPGASPSGSRGSFARVVLLVLNVVAVMALPFLNNALDQHAWDRYSQGYSEAQWINEESGLLNGGQEVCNIAAYDADGRPLTGVQLFDQAGRPLEVQCHGQASRTVPWVLGDVTRWNVFPLGERARPARTPERRADLEDAAFPVPDRATTPAVTNPLLPTAVEPDDRPDATEGRKKAGEKGDRAVSRR